MVLNFGSCDGDSMSVSCVTLRVTRKEPEVPNRDDPHARWTKILTAYELTQ